MLRHVAMDNCELKAVETVVRQIEMLRDWEASFIEPYTAFVIIES